MSTTYFENGNGSLSSSRSGNWSSGYSTSHYFGSDRGGLTVHSGNYVARFNNNGTCIGTGLTVGRHTTYWGRENFVRDKLTSF